MATSFVCRSRLKMSILLLGGLCAFTGSVYAQESPAWSGSVGPGTQTNYGIDVNDTTWLYITCKDAEPVSMQAAIKGQTYGSGEKDFKVIIDGNEYLSPPYKLQDFDSFWDALRNAQTLAISTSKGLTELPTQGLAEALPASNSPDYNCYTTSNTGSVAEAFDVEQLAVEGIRADMSQIQMGSAE